MRRLILFLSILPTILCMCPSGFDLVSNGLCRGKYATVTVRDDQATDMAIEKCDEIHGTPAIIHSDEEQSYWRNSAISAGRNYIILGLTCNASSHRWSWSDGSVVDFKPPSGSYNTDLEDNCESGCVWFLTSDAMWFKWCDTDNEPFSIFCTVQLALPTTDGCENFEDDNQDGVCYQVGDVAENWQDAQMICRKLGANLASIHSLQENSFVRRLAVTNGAVHGVYLGATISGKGGEFGWIDGSAWDYDYYYPGFPMPGFGDCVVMDTSTSTGQWMNIDCTSLLPVACIREKKPEITPTCNAGPWKEDSIITSPGFPYSSSTPCEYYLMTDAGKKVEVEIAFLEANSCCDSLIIYDGYVGGYVLATLTGEVRNVTYTTTSSNIMKVSWQPNGGVNVLGFAMTFRGV